MAHRATLRPLLGAAIGLGLASAALLPRLPAVAKVAPAARVAVVASGCSWDVKGVLQHVCGVTGAVSVYAGGTAVDADDTTVSRGGTDHAEARAVT